MRCFLGNGYQSTELSNNFGQGAGTCNLGQAPFPIMRVAGVYSYPNEIPSKFKRKTLHLDSLFRTLNTFGIFPLDPDNPRHPDAKNLDFYLPGLFKQVLDMKRAVVTTNAQVEDLLVETEVFLSRAHPNFGGMKVKVTKSNGGSFAFQHVTRKDPFTSLHEMKFTEIGLGKALWEYSIPEDIYEFQERGFYNIAQIAGLEVFDEHGHPLEFTADRSSEDGNKLGYDEIPVWRATVQCATPQVSSDNQYRWNIILYFGIYKQSDNEVPRFADASSSENQGERAIEGLTNVMELGYDALLRAHEAAWQKDIWQNLIEVPGADESIQRMIISSFYVIGCTYLEGLAYGNGPNGINGHWWAGRTFWDHDLWVNLGILLWAPELARNFNLLRFNTMAGALQNRKNYVALLEKEGIMKRLGLTITDGIKYPWESTTSGLERCPNGDKVPIIQEHIVCDVIHGMWLQYVVTQDQQFLEEIAFPVAFQSALYLGQRVKKEADGKWHFRYIQCADEFAERKDDNAFTNLYVEKCMGIVIDWCRLLGRDYPPHWEDIRHNMKYHFDEVHHRILEHATYSGQKIKQADTDLLTWPLEHPLLYGEGGEEIRRNNMLFYSSRLPKNHNMMSTCVFSIVAIELRMQEEAWEYFADQFLHFHPELSYIPSERLKNDCWPFITGVGGFLSNLIYGFGGIRLRGDGLLFAPRLDPKLPHLIIPRIKFQGAELRYEVVDGGQKFLLTSLFAAQTFTIYVRNERIYQPIENGDLSMMDVDGRMEKKFVIFLPANKPITFVLAEEDAK